MKKVLIIVLIASCPYLIYIGYMQLFQPLVGEIVSCGDNWMAGEIDNGTVTHQNGDYIVVSGHWEFWGAGREDRLPEYYTGEKATKLDHCYFVNPSRRQLIQKAKSIDKNIGKGF